MRGYEQEFSHYRGFFHLISIAFLSTGRELALHALTYRGIYRQPIDGAASDHDRDGDGNHHPYTGTYCYSNLNPNGYPHPDRDAAI